MTNTIWGEDQLHFEFGGNGTLKICGQERARWRVENSQVILCDDEGEEYTLDIVGNTFAYRGESINRFQ
ncbi:MAG: hypothetical protein HYV27_11870 [Candidatus Hydrogenedentes bacterium]|nr:hypothetical protein [Candidatus Hydrogenedentota bacterium]